MDMKTQKNRQTEGNCIMDEAMSVRELLDYYAERYKFTSTVDLKTGGSVYTALKRIFRDTPFNLGSLWDSMKPKKGSAHRIVLKDFELLCFPAWAAYIEKNLAGDYDIDQLRADQIVWDDTRAEEAYWRNEAETAVRAEYDALVQGVNVLDDDVEIDADIDEETEEKLKELDVADDIILSDDELFRKGIKLMLEGFFSYAYGGTFQWRKLKEDWEKRDLPSGLSDNAEAMEEVMKARARLKNFRSYIADEKK